MNMRREKDQGNKTLIQMNVQHVHVLCNGINDIASERNTFLIEAAEPEIAKLRNFHSNFTLHC